MIQCSVDGAGAPFGVGEFWFPTKGLQAVQDIHSDKLAGLVCIKLLLVVVKHERNSEYEDDVEAKAVYELLEPISCFPGTNSIYSCSNLECVTHVGAFAGCKTAVIKVPMGSTKALGAIAQALDLWQPKLVSQVKIICRAYIGCMGTNSASYMWRACF